MKEAKHHRLDLPDSQVILYPKFAAQQQATNWFDALQTEIPWAQKSILMFGKSVLQPRLVSWHGDENARYQYSGVMNEPLPWTPTLLEIKTSIEQTLALTFNSVLCNLYRNGQDSMGWHSDNEPELGDAPDIASLSLGAPRRFVLQHKKEKTLKAQFTLEHGDLLLMREQTQRLYRHAVPKTALNIGPRINLTFRRIFAH